MRTLLITASLLMTVLAGTLAAPAATAAQWTANCDQIEIRDIEMATSSSTAINPCEKLEPVLALPYALLAVALGTADSILDSYDQGDEDKDGVPDEVEEAICSRAILHDSINLLGQDVRCASESDLTVPDTSPFVDFVRDNVLDPGQQAVRETEEDVTTTVTMVVNLAILIEEMLVGAVFDTILLVDADGDGIADVLEPTFCAIEGSGDMDGSCNEDDTDYDPPF